MVSHFVSLFISTGKEPRERAGASIIAATVKYLAAFTALQV